MIVYFSILPIITSLIVSMHVTKVITQLLPAATAILKQLPVSSFQEKLGFSMNVLDIGGGYPGATDTHSLFIEVT